MCEVQATASADRRSVTMKLHPRITKLLGTEESVFQSPQETKPVKLNKPLLDVRELNTTVSIPDGGTAFLVVGPAHKDGQSILLAVSAKVIVPGEAATRPSD